MSASSTCLPAVSPEPIITQKLNRHRFVVGIYSFRIECKVTALTRQQPLMVRASGIPRGSVPSRESEQRTPINMPTHRSSAAEKQTEPATDPGKSRASTAAEKRMDRPEMQDLAAEKLKQPRLRESPIGLRGSDTVSGPTQQPVNVRDCGPNKN